MTQGPRPQPMRAASETASTGSEPKDVPHLFHYISERYRVREQIEAGQGSD